MELSETDEIIFHLRYVNSSLIYSKRHSFVQAIIDDSRSAYSGFQTFLNSPTIFFMIA
jgi:hypothetical protein